VTGKKIGRRGDIPAGGDGEPATALEALNAALEDLHRLDDAPYDGLMGRPPKWVPGPLEQEFYATRSALMESAALKVALEVSPKKMDTKEDMLRRWMRARRWMTGDRRMWGRSKKFAWVPDIPEILVDKVDALNYILALVELGVKEGEEAAIEAYLGKGGTEIVRGVVLHRQRVAGGKKTGKLKQEKADPDVKNILAEADALLEKGTNPRKITGLIVEKYDFTKSKVDRVRLNHRTRDWEKRPTN